MAQMNAGIILGGQQPDVVNALARGATAGALVNRTQQQNALRNLYQTQGAQIMAGDQNALNALAQHDPAAALDIRGKHETLALARDKARREAADYALKVGKEQAAQEAAELKTHVQRGIGFISSGDLNGVNAVLAEIGGPQVESIEQGQALLIGYGAAVEELEAARDLNAGPKPADEYGRYVQEERTAGREPLSRIEYAQAKKGKGTTVYDPETGQPMVTIGGGIEPPKMTVDAAKNTGFLIRVQDANEVLNGLEDQGLRFWQQNAEHVPFGLGNYARDPEFQKFDQARRDFVNAILRRESGAVISEQEFDNAEKQYFPVPGDSPEVIEQKRRNRENAIAGIRAGSGPGASYADQMGAPKNEKPEKEGGPKVGVIEDGYRFLGGDPADPNSWEKVS